LIAAGPLAVNSNGTFAGAVTAAAFNTSSLRALKTDIVTLGQAEFENMLAQVTTMPMYRFRYKSETATAPLHTGVMTDEAPAAILTADGAAVNLYDYVGLTAGATKALAEKVSALEAENAELRRRLSRLEQLLAPR
jgi:hypothetical protein